MVTNGNVTGLVERLEADNTIIRERLEDDRRVTVARLTEKGRVHFKAMAEAHERWVKEMMADVDPAIISSLLTQVGHVKDSAQHHLSEDD